MANKDYSITKTPPNIQRRPQNARDDDWIRSFLETAEIGHIATRWDDQPFLTPTTFWYDEAHERIIFHSNIVGRVRANIERHPKVCLEASRYGKFLPSNTALEFTVQYASVIVFGTAGILEDPEDRRQALYGLIGKYFPGMVPGVEYHPITDKELERTTVYAIDIESWSGKENWPEQAKQSNDWPPLVTSQD